MPDKPPVEVSFALALLAQEGVGRVTAHRLLERFPTYESLLVFPREQVLLRLKGTPNAERTVRRLFDEDTFSEALRSAAVEVKALADKHIHIITQGHSHWPAAFGSLDRPNRPVVLYVFGSTEALAGTSVAFHARPPLPNEAFESAQVLAQKLTEKGLPVTCGAQTGFDVVLHKLCSSAGAPCVMVAGSGLARVDNRARPSAAAAVRAGGVLVSPFPPRTRTLRPRRRRTRFPSGGISGAERLLCSARTHAGSARPRMGSSGKPAGVRSSRERFRKPVSLP